jgi:L-gulonolactone oxidase
LFQVFNFDCLFSQYVCEWAIPVDSLPEVFEKLMEMIANNNFKVHLPIEGMSREIEKC